MQLSRELRARFERSFWSERLDPAIPEDAVAIYFMPARNRYFAVVERPTSIPRVRKNARY